MILFRSKSAGNPLWLRLNVVLIVSLLGDQSHNNKGYTAKSEAGIEVFRGNKSFNMCEMMSLDSIFTPDIMYHHGI